MLKTVALVVFVAAVFVQTAPGPHISVLGAQADLLMVAVAAWAFARGHEEVMQTAPPAAVLAGLLEPGPIGVPLLSLLAPIGLAMLFRSRHHSERLPALLLAVLASTIWVFILGVSADLLSGQGFDRLAGAGATLLGMVALNLLAATLFYQPLRLARKGVPVKRTRVGLTYDLES